ncbi:MAG: hypothetical protein QM736_01855 [Vicinamibacterales bacterium]
MAFYKDVFGWNFPKWMEDPPYWGVMTAEQGSQEPGINGGLLQRHGAAPADGGAVNAYVCTVQVDAYDETHARILKAGGTVALPKHAIPGMAWQGYYKGSRRQHLRRASARHERAIRRTSSWPRHQKTSTTRRGPFSSRSHRCSC